MRALALVVLLLTGCANLPKPPDPVLVPKTKTVNIPDEDLQKCPPIPKLESRDYKEGELVALVGNIITMSDACRMKDSNLVDIVVKAFNINPKAAPSK